MKVFTLSFLAAVLVIVSGCDCFRALSGRPTSSEIDAMRQKMILELSTGSLSVQPADTVSVEQTVNIPVTVSPEMVMKMEKDSLDALAVIASKQYPMTYRRYSSENARYFLVVGSFKQLSNAENLSKQAATAGYPSGMLTSPNGITCVYVFRTDKIAEIVKAAAKYETQPLTNSGFYVLVNADRPQ